MRLVFSAKNEKCPLTAAEREERLTAYALLMGRRLTDTQLASVDEEWEALCWERGWSVESS